MAKKLSINDIANELGIAKSTVSFVLNGKAKEKRISDELAERVLKFVAESGYQRSHLAQSLSTGKTKMICLLVEKISDYFFSHIAYHLEEVAYQNGYKIIYCSTENDPEKTRQLLALLLVRQVDGYIITPPEGIESEISGLIDAKIPIVLFDRYLPDVPSDYVGLDNYNGTLLATRHLAATGCYKIALVTLSSNQTQMTERMDGYLAGLAEYRLEPIVLKIAFEKDASGAVLDCSQLIQDNPGLDAILFTTNYLALAGIKGIHELGLTMPGDISVIAFDDHDVFPMYNPPISAVVQPLEAISRQLFTTLLARLEGRIELHDVSRISIQPELVLRGSTRGKI